MNDQPVGRLSLREQRILNGDDPRRRATEAPFLQALFSESVDELIGRHSKLFLDDVGERTFAQRLGAIIERRVREVGLSNHYADVEYSRLYGATKYLPGDACICDNAINRVAGHDNITADLILHSRGIAPRSFDNLLAVEVKLKDDSRNAVVYDRCRLLRMSLENELNTAQSYRYAVFLVLRATRTQADRWRYLDQVSGFPGAAFEFDNRDNIGYYETFVLGESRGLRVFDRPIDVVL